MKGKKAEINKIASFVLNYFIKSNISVNHLKLQKVLYFIQAWHLVYFENNPLFDDIPEAWVNGPVYRPVYDMLKNKGIYDNILPENNTNYDEKFEESKNALKLDYDQFDFLNAILQHYGLFSHEKLILMTHSDAPWNIAREGLGPFDYSNNQITHESMFQFYKNRLNSNSDK